MFQVFNNSGMFMEPISSLLSRQRNVMLTVVLECLQDTFIHLLYQRGSLWRQDISKSSEERISILGWKGTLSRIRKAFFLPSHCSPGIFDIVVKIYQGTIPWKLANPSRSFLGHTKQLGGISWQCSWSSNSSRTYVWTQVVTLSNK